MKKTFFALILTVALLSFAACALADETFVINDVDLVLDISVSLPDDYTLLHDHQNGHLYMDFIAPEENGTVYSLVVAHSEEYAEQTMIDMSEEEIAHIISLVSWDYAAPEVEQMTVGDQTLLCIFKETGSESSYACIVTIYHGYFITEHIHCADDAPLTDADIQTAIDLLAGMQFSIRP